MSTNKNASIRYKALDKCFRDFRHRYFIDDLIEKCEEELESFNFIGQVGRRQMQYKESIATYLDEKAAKIDSSIKSLETQRDDLNALKQSIISEAVAGKIDVRDWKSNNN